VDIPQIGVDALEGILGTRATLLDVREPDDYAGCRITGTQRISLPTFPTGWMRFHQIRAST